MGKRKNHLVNRDYSQKVNKLFDFPKIEHIVIKNNEGKEEIVKQIKEILEIK